MTLNDLTPKERAAIVFLVEVCMDGMGGGEPKDLYDDPYTWIDPEDLVGQTEFKFTKNQVSGMWSTLDAKALISLDSDGDTVNMCSVDMVQEGKYDKK